jgi:hypothetical protein
MRSQVNVGAYWNCFEVNCNRLLLIDFLDAKYVESSLSRKAPWSCIREPMLQIGSSDVKSVIEPTTMHHCSNGNPLV